MTYDTQATCNAQATRTQATLDNQNSRLNNAQTNSSILFLKASGTLLHEEDGLVTTQFATDENQLIGARNFLISARFGS